MKKKKQCYENYERKRSFSRTFIEMNASSGSRMGRLGSGRKGPSRPVPVPDARDYEYFQLYDPEDSDIADEDDPDVRNLLVNSWSAGTGPRKILKNELLKDCLSCCCCCCKPYAWWDSLCKNICTLSFVYIFLKEGIKSNVSLLCSYKHYFLFL